MFDRFRRVTAAAAVGPADQRRSIIEIDDADGSVQTLLPTRGSRFEGVAFSPAGDAELLAVAQRAGAITVYERRNAGYTTKPVFEIAGQQSRLKHSDGVAFVPPHNEYLAACNLLTHRISFYRKTSRSPLAFTVAPVFELKHRSLGDPDGLAFTRCGRWLAVANHGKRSVSIFRRRRPGIFSRGALRYGPWPVTVIKDPALRYPHSVAFTDMQWSPTPALRKTVGPDTVFREVNARNKMEGGPKGIAAHGHDLAICSPEYGVKIYALRERVAIR